MRTEPTDAEAALWRLLRGRRFIGFKFRRQVPLGPFIADFLCFEARVIVELDGGQHAESKADLGRDAWFAQNGFAVARYWNIDVLGNPEGVWEDLLRRLKGGAGE